MVSGEPTGAQRRPRRRHPVERHTGLARRG
jgi:hypothetical protein